MHSTAEPGRSASSSSSTSTSLLVASVIRHCRSSNQATGRSSCWREVACRSGLPAWQPSQACGAPRSRSLVPQCLLQHHRQASTVAACVFSEPQTVRPSCQAHIPIGLAYGLAAQLPARSPITTWRHLQKLCGSYITVVLYRANQRWPSMFLSVAFAPDVKPCGRIRKQLSRTCQLAPALLKIVLGITSFHL